ncbi:hypothetical protein BDV06DRAFT_228493 [Aspergillus oleicola]
MTDSEAFKKRWNFKYADYDDLYYWFQAGKEPKGLEEVYELTGLPSKARGKGAYDIDLSSPPFQSILKANCPEELELELDKDPWGPAATIMFSHFQKRTSKFELLVLMQPRHRELLNALEKVLDEDKDYGHDINEWPTPTGPREIVEFYEEIFVYNR